MISDEGLDTLQELMPNTRFIDLIQEVMDDQVGDSMLHIYNAVSTGDNKRALIEVGKTDAWKSLLVVLRRYAATKRGQQ